MKVLVYKNGDTIKSDIECVDIKSCLSLLKLHHGKEFTDDIISNNYKFILFNENDIQNAISLNQDVIFSPFEGYDSLIIIKDIGGEIPAVAIASLVSMVGVTLSTTALTVLTAVANLAVSIVTSALMNLISPTPEFSGDPSTSQKTSNLFNGGVLNAEAGGPVPYLFGNCFCGGKPISSTIESSDT